MIIREAATLGMKPINWLWPHWLARGKLHILAGAPGTAKTTLGIEIVANVWRGGHWPDDTVAPRGDVLFRRRRRLEIHSVPLISAALFDLSRVKFIAATQRRD